MKIRTIGAVLLVWLGLLPLGAQAATVTVRMNLSSAAGQSATLSFTYEASASVSYALDYPNGDSIRLYNGALISTSFVVKGGPSGGGSYGQLQFRDFDNVFGFDDISIDPNGSFGLQIFDDTAGAFQGPVAPLPPAIDPRRFQRVQASFDGNQTFTHWSIVDVTVIPTSENAVEIVGTEYAGAGGGSKMLGWDFTPTTDIVLTALGFRDRTCGLAAAVCADGLAEEHPVAIWDSSRNLLAYATLPPGTGAPRVGPQFRYVAIPEITLTAGQTYTIAALNPAPDNDGSSMGANGSLSDLDLDPRISYVQSRYKPFVAGFTYPDAGTAYALPFLGPSFLIKAENEPPVADAGANQMIRAGENVCLNGGASYDDNTASGALQYAWTFSALPNGSSAALTGANTATPCFSADVADTYSLQLVVTDEGGLSSAADFVEVGSNNLPPTADAGPDQLVVVGTVVTLDGSGSTDPENESLAYLWTISSTPTGSVVKPIGGKTATASFTAAGEGIYEATLVVSDALGAGTPDSVSILSTTATEYADILILETNEAVIALTTSQVTTPGNQQAFTNTLIQATEASQNGNTAQAITKLQNAIERTDGCVLRGAPDGNGPGRDWITDCAAQAETYPSLKAALDALME